MIAYRYKLLSTNYPKQFRKYLTTIQYKIYTLNLDKAKRVIITIYDKHSHYFSFLIFTLISILDHQEIATLHHYYRYHIR